jgi:hypothetical protein
MKFNTQNKKKKKKKRKLPSTPCIFLGLCFPAQWIIVKRQTYVQTQMPPQKEKGQQKTKKNCPNQLCSPVKRCSIEKGKIDTKQIIQIKCCIAASRRPAAYYSQGAR